MNHIFFHPLRLAFGGGKFLLFLAGALATLALPPVNILPLIFLSLAILIHQISTAQSWQQAFARGWFWGAGYFIFGLYWISFALRFDWPKFAWLLPLSVFALPCAMAVYSGLAALATHVMARRFQNRARAAILLFPFFWLEFEIIRGHLFTGFPWNLLGSVLTDYAPWFQMASVIGVYGLGFVMCASVSLWLLYPKKYVRSGILAAWAVVGALGFARMEMPDDAARSMNIRVVQPNIAQSGRWDSARKSEILGHLLTLTASPGAAPQWVVWPEAASPYLLENRNLIQRISQSLPPGAVLATGSIRRDAETKTLYNSIQYLSASGQILGYYDKSHLVPFGEFMPFSDIIPIPAVAQFFGNLGRGQGAETQSIAGVRVSPLICYEAIFPAAVTDDQSPQFFINVTDDVWYGHTAGPYQHLAAARARSVEEGLPMVRAANNGISAIIDRFGRITASLPYDATGVLDAQISLSETPPRPPGAGGMFYAYLALLAAGYYALGRWLSYKFQ